MVKIRYPKHWLWGQAPDPSPAVLAKCLQTTYWGSVYLLIKWRHQHLSHFQAVLNPRKEHFSPCHLWIKFWVLESGPHHKECSDGLQACPPRLEPSLACGWQLALENLALPFRNGR